MGGGEWGTAEERFRVLIEMGRTVVADLSSPGLFFVTAMEL